MPLRAFIDSENPHANSPQVGEFSVLMPLRAFIDSEAAAAPPHAAAVAWCLNALTGIY